MKKQMQTLLQATKSDDPSYWAVFYTVLAVAIGFGAQIGVNHITDRHLLFCLIPPVAIVAWYHGFRIALTVAWVMAISADMFLFEPHFTLDLNNRYDLVTLMAYLAIATPTAWIFSKLSRRTHLLLLAQSELEMTLRSIGDAVLVVDKKKNVAFLNPVAEKLTGWTVAEARGRPVHDIFRILDQTTRQEALNPIDKVLRDGEVAGLAQNTLLISQDGSEYRIEESAAPIQLSERGNIAGVVLVFRDVTNRYLEEAAKLAQQKETQAAKDEAERRRKELYSFFMQAPAPMVVLTGPQYRFSLVNPLYEKFVGRKVLGKTVREVFNDEELKSFIPIMDHVFRTGEPFIGRELPLVLKDENGIEQSHRIDLSYTAFRNDEGQVHGLMVFIQDVTENVRARERSEKHTERLERLANSIPQIVYIFDSSGKTIFLNDRWYQYTGDVRSRPQRDTNPFVHPDDLLTTYQAWTQAFKSQQAFQSELRIRGADGQYRWFITRAAPNIDDGALIGWFGTSTDIHDEKEKRREAEFLNSVSQTFSQSTADIRELTRNIVSFAIKEFSGWAHVHLLEPSGRIRLVAVKHTRDEYTEISWRYDERFPTYLDVKGGLGDIIRSGQTQYQREITTQMLEAVSPEQQEILKMLNLKSSIAVALKTSQKAFGVLTLISDERLFDERDVALAEELAERSAYAIQNAQLVEELRRAKDEAVHANELKSAFLANMSHEIRTPLGAMMGFADLLRDPQLSYNEREKYSEILSRNGENLSVIINDILDLSKVEAGQLVLDYESVDVCRILDDVVALFRIKAQAKNLILESTLDSQLPKTLVTDALRVRQILNNIVGNAIKFTQEGFIRVRAITVERAGGEKYLGFEVSDTGIGIPESQREKIFEVFVQADGSVTRRFGGTGLGLALSKKLANALGGDIEILNSELNSGSTFLITIRDQSEKKPLGLKRDSHHHLEMVNDSQVLLDRQILVVDDSADNLQLIELILKKQGARVDFAENGLVGYNKALQKDYDIILMDIQMPEMDGYTATQNLRMSGYHRPIIALTAHAMSEVQKRCLEVGCNRHLPKPIDRTALVNAIVELVD